VAEAARRHGLALHKTSTLKDTAARAPIAAAGCDVLVVAAFGMILPPEVLALPPRGCVNIHASLLPRWRGAAPIQRAILAGDAQTGITIMRMDAGLDTGPALLQQAVPIAERETTGSLTETLAALGARCIVEALGELDRLVPRAQDAGHATYAAKIEKREAAIDWGCTSTAIDRQVRAFDPAPGAETQLDGHALKVWEAQPVPGAGAPGEILAAGASGLVVACGEGAIRLGLLQRAGGKRLAAADFLRGQPLKPGQFLGADGVPAGT